MEQADQPAGGRPVVDFDHHSAEFAADPYAVYRELRARCPVAFTPHHGGYWVVSRYDDVATAARDDDTYASEHDIDGTGRGYQGVVIPPVQGRRAGPIEMDPPEFSRYRRVLNPRFSPAALERITPRIREVTTEFVDRVIERGEFDIVLDLAGPVPAVLTLVLLGLPVDEWERYAEPMHRAVYTRKDDPEWPEVLASLGWVNQRLDEEIEKRRQSPTDDLISYLVTSEVDGRPMDPAIVGETCFLILSGGVDTTTALIANALLYLHHHHDERERLKADPSLIPAACEEFLRYYTPVQGLARTATRECELGGQQLAEGDRLWLSWAAANRDEDMFPKPDEVVLDRFPNRHAAFGLGIHRCLGSNFARAEFCTVVEEVLRRMPDYRVDEDRARKYTTIGTVYGWITVPATFTPGPREGTGTTL